VNITEKKQEQKHRSREPRAVAWSRSRSGSRSRSRSGTGRELAQYSKEGRIGKVAVLVVARMILAVIIELLIFAALQHILAAAIDTSMKAEVSELAAKNVLRAHLQNENPVEQQDALKGLSGLPSCCGETICCTSEGHRRSCPPRFRCNANQSDVD
jgi:hypothetical protein